MLKNALDEPNSATAGDFYEIQPRSIFFEHLKLFTDPTVISVFFFEPDRRHPERRLHQGPGEEEDRRRVEGDRGLDAGALQAVLPRQEGRTARGAADRRQQPRGNRGAEVPFRFPKLLPMLTSSSNVGCWRWLGESSVAISGGTPVVDSRASAVNMLWVVSDILPGRIVLGRSSGTIAGDTTITDACTTTMAGTRRELYRGLGDIGIPKPDGTLDFNLDLDLGFSEIGGESPNRQLITLTGTTVLDTTITAVCPGVTTSPASARIPRAGSRSTTPCRPAARPSSTRWRPTARRSRVASPASRRPARWSTRSGSSPRCANRAGPAAAAPLPGRPRADDTGASLERALDQPADRPRIEHVLLLEHARRERLLGVVGQYRHRSPGR